jgi:single-strand DNA-binding protein
MNTITLTGRLTRDPEPGSTRGGTPVCELRIALDGRNGTVYVPITTYGTLAETAARYLIKGRLVAVTGRLAHDEWTGPAGECRSRLYAIGRAIDFLDGPNVPAGGDGEEEQQ